MPYRKTPIAPGQIYHVFNRSIAREPIFFNRRDYQRALMTIEYYTYYKPNLRFSHYNRLPRPERQKFLEDLRKKKDKQIKLFAFVLMPNHFHFLLREIRDKGISSFISNIQNSYAKYLNIKIKRNGALFQSMFKIVRIETEEQFIHVARYIHLNPLTSYVIKEENQLEHYPWSSYPFYLGKRRGDFIDKELLMKYYTSVEDLRKFTVSQINYQRALAKIRHLTLE